MGGIGPINVRFWRSADIPTPAINVRFEGKSGHRILSASDMIRACSRKNGGSSVVGGPAARLRFTLTREIAPLKPILLSFDVFGTLISVRDGSYGVFRSILVDCARTDVRVQDFWEYWEERNVAHYWEPYRPYKEICELSLGEAFAHFGVRGNPSLIRRYFDAFRRFELYPDVLPTLDVLCRRHRLAIVSNIDDDLLAATPLGREFDLVCTAERARGYKSDGTLFRYLIAHSGVSRDEILHVGQSQFTDMVGGKPLGLTIAWINRRGVDLHPSVPRPDFIFGDIASLIPLLDERATIRNG